MKTIKAFVAVCASILAMQTVSGTATISMIGNKIEASASGIDVIGATFLLRNVILSEGVLFAYSAYFRSDKPVTFQIWRPVNDTLTPNSYRLIGQTKDVIATRIMTREDVYIESRLTEKCIRVRTGDRLGVFLTNSPGAVAYVFQSMSPTALAHKKANASEAYAHDDAVEFDSLAFPYDFSVAAYISTDLSTLASSDDDLVDCPRSTFIPVYEPVGTLSTTTVPPPTGAPGATGPAGPAGPAGATGPAGPAGATGQPGRIGPTGATGEAGAPGVGLPGATGPRGAAGATGAAGARGEKGNTGERGADGAPGHTIYVNEGNATRPTPASNIIASGSTMGWVVLVWLIIVTLAIVILLIVIVVIFRRRRSPGSDTHVLFNSTRFPEDADAASDKPSWIVNEKDDRLASYDNVAYSKPEPEPKDIANNRMSVPAFTFEHETAQNGKTNNPAAADTTPEQQQQHQSLGRTNSALSGAEEDPNWMNTMKSTTETIYSNETLTRQNSKSAHKDNEAKTPF